MGGSTWRASTLPRRLRWPRRGSTITTRLTRPWSQLTLISATFPWCPVSGKTQTTSPKTRSITTSTGWCGRCSTRGRSSRRWRSTRWSSTPATSSSERTLPCPALLPTRFSQAMEVWRINWSKVYEFTKSHCRPASPLGLPLLQDAAALLQPAHHGQRSPPLPPVRHPPHRLQLRERRHRLQAQLAPQAPLPGQQGGVLQERDPDLRQGRRHDPLPRGPAALRHAQPEQELPNRNPPAHGSSLHQVSWLTSFSLIHLMLLLIRPFESMAEYVRDDIKAKASMGLKRLLAMDHPYPMLKL